MQQNSFVVPTKHFSISIKFSLLKQNVLLGEKNVLSGQQQKFCCIHFFSQCPKEVLGILSMLFSTIVSTNCS